MLTTSTITFWQDIQPSKYVCEILDRHIRNQSISMEALCHSKYGLSLCTPNHLTKLPIIKTRSNQWQQQQEEITIKISRPTKHLYCHFFEWQSEDPSTMDKDTLTIIFIYFILLLEIFIFLLLIFHLIIKFIYMYIFLLNKDVRKIHNIKYKKKIHLREAVLLCNTFWIAK